jgi:hypothetical protein
MAPCCEPGQARAVRRAAGLAKRRLTMPCGGIARASCQGYSTASTPRSAEPWWRDWRVHWRRGPPTGGNRSRPPRPAHPMELVSRKHRSVQGGPQAAVATRLLTASNYREREQGRTMMGLEQLCFICVEC